MLLLDRSNKEALQLRGKYNIIGDWAMVFLAAVTKEFITALVNL